MILLAVSRLAHTAMLRGLVICTATLLLLTTPTIAFCLEPNAVNDATWSERSAKTGNSLDPLLVKAQILLDRAQFSPGEIDGKWGENAKKALKAYAIKEGVPTDGLSKEIWQKLNAPASEPALIEYSLTANDVRGPFVEKLPARMEDMQSLPALGYTSPREKIAEKFHMSEELLGELNPDSKFLERDHIYVANVLSKPSTARVARLEIDKTEQTLKAFDRNGRLISFVPVTAGSAEKPALSGQFKVTRIAKNPTYRYNPDYQFRGVRSTEPFTIKPGPNNPVGLVWIALSEPGYGIHGTPDASKVSKTESHGCIRLTNWDALKLAGLVSKGTTVVFSGDESARPAKGKAKRKLRGALPRFSANRPNGR